MKSLMCSTSLSCSPPQNCLASNSSVTSSSALPIATAGDNLCLLSKHQTTKEGRNQMKTNVRWIAVMVFGALLFGGCNSYKVTALPYDPELRQVVVVRNPEVIVKDFVEVMIDEFSERGIKVLVMPSNYAAKPTEYVIRYIALQSWDLSTYLSDATIRISKDDIVLAKGRYHHVGGSCSLDIFTKWRGTEWKMGDLYDELLKNYPKRQ